jgi:glycosyltransferase involved in cell wall biosynthesis
LLNQITPLILTYNEAANIRRSLSQLRWAEDIVVVDSYSDDGTVELASEMPQVRVVQRRFDSHQNQWNFGVNETGIKTAWVLALDADYVLTPTLVEEVAALSPKTETEGFSAPFLYCIKGKQLRSGIYPPVTVLYRRDKARYTQNGHTQRLVLSGKVEMLSSPILHDDRKPLRRWLQAQQRYAELEANRLIETDAQTLSWRDRVRRWRVVAPLAICFYCLVLRGGILDGYAGFYYAFQRTLAELILSLYLLDHDLQLRNQP